MKRLACIGIIVLLVISLSLTSFAHSGRTDSSGGHKDNKNASGLGSYHYHHGYGPHLHEGGICPYSPKDTIKVSNMPSKMKLGESVNLSWDVTYHSGSSSVSWESSDSSVVKTGNGTLQAVGEGTATITATMRNGSKTFKVTVTPIYVETVELGNAPEQLEVGNTAKLSATIEPADATHREVSWTSSKESVATVSDAGVVTALSTGTVTITATTPEKKKASVKIEVFEIFAEELAVETTELSVPLAHSLPVLIKVLPEDTSMPELTWSSSDDTIATVEDGLVTALAVGDAVITVMCQKLTATIPVTVFEVKAEEIKVDVTSLTVAMGDKGQVSAEVLPEDAADRLIVWTSGDKRIATVNSDGKVTPVAAGKTTITATCGEITKAIPIEVFVATTALSIDTEAIEGFDELKKGSIVDIPVLFEPQDATYTDYTLESSDTSIAVIAGSRVEVVGTGKVVITATSGTLSDSTELAVKGQVPGAAVIGGAGVLGVAVLLGAIKKKK